MQPIEDTTLFPWRITKGKEVVLPLEFLVDECKLRSGDHVRIQVRAEGLAFTPMHTTPLGTK